MTTTDVFQGMGPDSKNSSRVLRPPGGASSFSIFGGGDETPAPAVVGPASPPVPAAGTVTPNKPTKENVHETRDRLYGGGSSDTVHVRTGGNPKNMGFNPITGLSNNPATPNLRAPREPERHSRGRGLCRPMQQEVTRATGDFRTARNKGTFNTTTSETVVNQTEGTFDPIACKELSQPKQEVSVLPPKEEKPVHTSTRVRQPPGGASSGLW